MAFRGYLTLNGEELANSSRVAAHLSQDAPVLDWEIFGNTGWTMEEDPPGSGMYVPHPNLGTTRQGQDGFYPTGDLDGYEGLYRLPSAECTLVEANAGLFVIPATSELVSDGLYTPPPGSRRFGPGLMEVGKCWGPPTLCGCRLQVPFDDSWPGLRDWLGDTIYRPELAPWHSVEIPESAEFGGVWVTDIKGLDATPVERPITELSGPGGVAGPHRDKTRTLTFEAVLVACTNAGLEFGLKWLACRLRETIDTSAAVLRYLTAHPGHSAADPDLLVRDLHGVVLTKEPEVTSATVGAPQHQQATIYRIRWEMAATSPYAYLPRLAVPAVWDEVTYQPINWVHDVDCIKPESCDPMPTLFSTECVPEEIELHVVPPPVCGGCLPVGGLWFHRLRVPTMTTPFRCRETAVTVTIRNTGNTPLSLQGFFRPCGTDIRCEAAQFPVQVSGLPGGADLTLDGITGRYRVFYDNRWRKAVGMVGTPNGAPWRPPLIDRQQCWDFIVQTGPDADFEVELVLADREP